MEKVVLASPGVTKTPFLEKATEDGVQNLQESRNSKFFPTSEALSEKLNKIVEAKKPKCKYNLAMDAGIVDKVLTRFIPFGWRVAMNKRMFKLK